MQESSDFATHSWLYVSCIGDDFKFHPNLQASSFIGVFRRVAAIANQWSWQGFREWGEKKLTIYLPIFLASSTSLQLQLRCQKTSVASLGKHITSTKLCICLKLSKSNTRLDSGKGLLTWLEWIVLCWTEYTFCCCSLNDRQLAFPLGHTWSSTGGLAMYHTFLSLHWHQSLDCLVWHQALSPRNDNNGIK